MGLSRFLLLILYRIMFCNDLKPGLPPLHAIKILHRDNLLASRQITSPTLRQWPLSSFATWTNLCLRPTLYRDTLLTHQLMP